ncbi:MAG: hypothetical protein HY277_08495 [Ignavibacteriales bacterium]|nr:hypothetical protein [Ignavibacteriales bacterium]
MQYEPRDSYHLTRGFIVVCCGKSQQGVLNPMDENVSLKKFLTWAGIVTLVALPVVVLLKRRNKQRSDDRSVDDDSNIFAAELEE